MSRAFDGGRRSVVELLATAHREAVQQLDVVEGELAPDLAAGARRRLDEVAQRLAVAS